MRGDSIRSRRVLLLALQNGSGCCRCTATPTPRTAHKVCQLYASIDEAEGLFWAYERSGLIDAVVSEDLISHAIEEPPEDTRAWTRAKLLRRAGAARVEDIDWDRVGVRLHPHGRSYPWTTRTVVSLPCPYKSTKGENDALFSSGRSLEDIVAALEPERSAPAVYLPVNYTVC